MNCPSVGVERTQKEKKQPVDIFLHLGVFLGGFFVCLFVFLLRDEQEFVLFYMQR